MLKSRSLEKIKDTDLKIKNLNKQIILHKQNLVTTEYLEKKKKNYHQFLN